MATRYWLGLLLLSFMHQSQGTAAKAGDCYRQRYIAPYVAPVKAVVLHQIGYGIREEALAELAAEKALAKFKLALGAERQAITQGVLSDLRLRGTICVDVGGGATVNTAGGASGTSGGPSVPSLPPAPPGDHSAAQAVFNESCTSCHSGATAKGGLDLSDLSKLPAAKLQKAALRANSGSMPPKPAAPIADEKAALLMKLAEGLPSQ